MKFREVNGHIAEATNSAFELASGDYVAMLDHDDVLRPHALAEVAFALEEHPKAELLYSDEDKIEEDGSETPSGSAHTCSAGTMSFSIFSQLMKLLTKFLPSFR